MKATVLRFLTGPNVHDVSSGILARVDLGAGPPRWNEGPDREAALRRCIAWLRETMPVSRESEDLADVSTLAAARLPWAALTLTLTEVLVRDFTLVPRKGHVVQLADLAAVLFVPCDEPELGDAALNFSLSVLAVMASAIPKADDVRFEEFLASRYADLRTRLRAVGLNQSTLAVARAACRRGVPAYRLQAPGQLLQLGQGAHRQRVMETVTDQTGSIARGLAADKFKTVSLLRAHGLPTPDSRLVSSRAQALAAASELGYPVVVKPRSLGKGKGVHVRLPDEAALVDAVEAVAALQAGVIVERHIEGHDHRLLVVGGRLVAVARRMPAAVEGNGVDSVRALIAAANNDPRRGMKFERVLERIEVDDEARQQLGLQGLSLDSVPAQGARIVLRGAANISRGGTSVDFTDEVHPDNRQMAERAARLVGLDVTGIDFITPDIGRSWRDTRGAILEVNPSPGLRPHLAADPASDVAGAIVEHLFPGGSPGRVPTIAVTGSLGKTTTCRLIASIWSQAGRRVALTTTQAMSLGDELVAVGDLAGGKAARTLLQDPGAEVGVFEFARGALLKRGMGLDRVDVGLVLNVLDNHVGLDGIESRQAMAEVKSLVVRNACQWAVLNADDPLCLAMRGVSPAARVCLVGEHESSPAMQDHLLSEGVAVVLSGPAHDARIVLRRGAERLGEWPLSAIPVTWSGRFRPGVANAMFAIAGAFAMGAPIAAIGPALAGFVSTERTNPGRMNFVEGLPYRLLLTVADGPEALGSLTNWLRGQEPPQACTILLQMAGNRPDSYILACCRSVAGGYGRYVCVDHEEDLRGRAPGELVSLMERGLMDAGVAREAIEGYAQGTLGIERAMRTTPRGELLVIVHYDYAKVLALADQIRSEAAG